MHVADEGSAATVFTEPKIVERTKACTFMVMELFISYCDVSFHAVLNYERMGKFYEVNRFLQL